ncbi:cytochrome b5-like heme/steroid binding domain-containing protein [Sphaerosporella brunnea]|uniref:Cytochrome b5-like heme/steroid binding domain-containing protein n=1 Tax=Sphaerosporella brunnea TaxID=1250544 RepID=A0A5J5F1U8_9PEZI|nr:cytochrome b5-like heme/steroid binding domain-containing protein [Sphaerosporella brunnea]
MSEKKVFTYEEVKEHNSKKDLYMVIHDKVYNVSSFVDEHPGGEEVLMDVGGVDATDSFEDVGHSDEARELLESLYVGKLKRTASDPVPKLSQSPSAPGTTSADAGTAFYAFFFIAAVVAFGAYKYMQ